MRKVWVASEGEDQGSAAIAGNIHQTIVAEGGTYNSWLQLVQAGVPVPLVTRKSSRI
jgi:hypothetical protein